MPRSRAGPPLVQSCAPPPSNEQSAAARADLFSAGDTCGGEQAKADPQKNVLIRTVGFEPEVEVDTYRYKIQKNDIFLLCSDGLHGKVSDEDIIHLVNKFIPEPMNAKQQQLDDLVSELIKQANANGGQDNISVIIAVAN